jgi:hypothetical protein
MPELKDSLAHRAPRQPSDEPGGRQAPMEAGLEIETGHLAGCREDHDQAPLLLARLLGHRVSLGAARSAVRSPELPALIRAACALQPAGTRCDKVPLCGEESQDLEAAHGR